LRFLWCFLALLAGALVIYPIQNIGTLAAATEVRTAPAYAPAEPEVPPTPARPRVAVIDSGIARTAELSGSLVAEYDMGVTPGRPVFQPHDSHGTMVATILLREARQPIDIISLRIDDPAGCPPGSNPPCQPDAEPIANAIRKATDLNVSAINISLNLKDHPLIVDAVRDASERGIRVVLAAGNDGRDRPGNLAMATAGFPNTILVGAVDAAGQPWKGTNRPQAGTPGYHYVWQYGVSVPTAMADGTNAVATGTSFAAPIETARLLTALRQT
jgi:hypothetical protein